MQTSQLRADLQAPLAAVPKTVADLSAQAASLFANKPVEHALATARIADVSAAASGLKAALQPYPDPLDAALSSWNDLRDANDTFRADQQRTKTTTDNVTKKIVDLVGKRRALENSVNALKAGASGLQKATAAAQEAVKKP